MNLLSEVNVKRSDHISNNEFAICSHSAPGPAQVKYARVEESHCDAAASVEVCANPIQNAKTVTYLAADCMSLEGEAMAELHRLTLGSVLPQS